VPPLSDFEANLVNSLGNIAGSMPAPVSFIRISTKNLSPSSFFCSAEITTLPGSSVNLMALLRRLETTCDILTLSPCIMKLSREK
jgi:hypothetical protein